MARKKDPMPRSRSWGGSNHRCPHCRTPIWISPWEQVGRWLGWDVDCPECDENVSAEQLEANNS